MEPVKAAAFALLATLAFPAGSQQDVDWYTGEHSDLFLAEPEQETTGIDWQVQDAYKTWSTELPQAYGQRGVWVASWLRDTLEDE